MYAADEGDYLVLFLFQDRNALDIKKVIWRFLLFTFYVLIFSHFPSSLFNCGLSYIVIKFHVK